MEIDISNAVERQIERVFSNAAIVNELQSVLHKWLKEEKSVRVEDVGRHGFEVYSTHKDNPNLLLFQSASYTACVEWALSYKPMGSDTTSYCEPHTAIYLNSYGQSTRELLDMIDHEKALHGL